MAVKTKVVFDLTPEENERLEAVAKALGLSKVGFLRKAIEQAEENLKEEK